MRPPTRDTSAARAAWEATRLANSPPVDEEFLAAFRVWDEAWEAFGADLPDPAYRDLRGAYEEAKCALEARQRSRGAPGSVPDAIAR